MLKIEKTAVNGWEAAIRGMRNPMNSWDKSDSRRYQKTGFDIAKRLTPLEAVETFGDQVFAVGPNDYHLMLQLANNGSVHAKYRRMITVTCDITAPLYWWKEYDTYKVGTVANSCSTMHKLAEKEFDISDFSCEHLNAVSMTAFVKTIDLLNNFRVAYLEESDPVEKKSWWWQMIQLLPSSYNQKRTVLVNYEVLAGIYISRKGHKLDEWKIVCEWISELPLSPIITLEG